MEIHKGLYGLPQAGILANKILQENIGMSRVLRATAHTRTMETCNLSGVVQPMCGWFSVLSILDANIYNIYTMHYARKHMKLLKIGRATYIVGLH
jgi:hypothetical protein